MVVDVVIVGGGPAGAVAALTCARAGRRVVLCERERVRPSGPPESLHPGCEVLLDRLGLGPAFRALAWPRYPGVEVGGRFTAFGADARGPWLGFHVDRERFDAMLLAAAQAAGVELRRGLVVRGLRREGGQIRGVVTDDGPLPATWVIDASGRGHWAARQLDLRKTTRSPPLLAWRGLVHGRLPDPDRRAYFTAEQGGWCWQAQIDERVVWTRLRPRAAPAPLVPAAVQPASEDPAIQPRRGFDVTWRALRPLAQPGLMLAGDAAAVVDPAAGQGVFFALESGARVAEAVCGGGSALALARYDDWAMREFERKVSALQLLYAELGIELFAC